MTDDPVSDEQGWSFSWRQLWLDARQLKWEFYWDDRKPLPSFAGAVHCYYDYHFYAARLWRFTVTLS